MLLSEFLEASAVTFSEKDNVLPAFGRPGRFKVFKFIVLTRGLPGSSPGKVSERELE